MNFWWISFSLADSFDGLELDVEFNFDDFELFPEDLDFLSNLYNFFASFNQLWILYLKVKTLSPISLNNMSSV